MVLDHQKFLDVENCYSLVGRFPLKTNADAIAPHFGQEILVSRSVKRFKKDVFHFIYSSKAPQFQVCLKTTLLDFNFMSSGNKLVCKMQNWTPLRNKTKKGPKFF